MGEGMTEAQLDALTQQTVGMAYLFVGLAGLLLYLAHLGPDGLRRWERLRDHFFTVKGSLGPAADYVDGYEADRDPDALTSAASRQEAPRRGEARLRRPAPPGRRLRRRGRRGLGPAEQLRELLAAPAE